MAMTAPHRNSLQRCRVALEQDLQPDSLFSYLIQESVLAVDTVDEIKLEGTRLKKSQKLLDILPTFGDHAFHVFCFALGETGQGFLSDLIQQDVLESSQDAASPYQGRENLVKILAEELKHYYLETLSRVYPIPWCDWLEVDLQHIFTNLVIEETNRYIDVAELFEPSIKEGPGGVGSLPRSVLIQGDPGIGKSTLSRKLVYDWSLADGNPPIKKYDLVFLIEARHLQEGIKEAIFKQLLPKDFTYTPDQVWEAITGIQERVLFIVDGYDELRYVEQTNLFDLFSGKILSKSHNIVTSRPHSITGIKKNFRKHVIIKGFSKADSKSYIEKYFTYQGKNSEEYKELISSIENKPEMQNLATNPFNTVLLCLIFEDNPHAVVSNKIQVYQEVEYSVCKRLCTKFDIPTRGTDLPEVCLRVLENLYFMAFYGNLNNQLRFSEENIREKLTKEIDLTLQSGFLTKEFSVSRIRFEEFYFFPHKTLQEYFSGKYIACHPEESLEEIHTYSLTPVGVTASHFDAMVWGIKCVNNAENMLKIARKATEICYRFWAKICGHFDFVDIALYPRRNINYIFSNLFYVLFQFAPASCYLGPETIAAEIVPSLPKWVTFPLGFTDTFKWLLMSPVCPVTHLKLDCRSWESIAHCQSLAAVEEMMDHNSSMTNILLLLRWSATSHMEPSRLQVVRNIFKCLDNVPHVAVSVDIEDGTSEDSLGCLVSLLHSLQHSVSIKTLIVCAIMKEGDAETKAWGILSPKDNKLSPGPQITALFFERTNYHRCIALKNEQLRDCGPLQEGVEIPPIPATKSNQWFVRGDIVKYIAMQWKTL